MHHVNSPAMPQAGFVADGILSIPIPMPKRTMPYSLCYAIEDASGDVHLIDAGMDAEGNWDALVAGLALGGKEISDIATITTTHLHHDHAGLAARVRSASGAKVGMHIADAKIMVAGGTFSDPFSPDEMLDQFGVPADLRSVLLPIAARKVAIGEMVTIDTLLSHGDRIDVKGRHAEVIHTPGHTPGEVVVMLFGEGIVFTGDHLLPSAFPGIGLGGRNHAAGADPIRDYLDSLDVLEGLDANLALPGHEGPFADPRARIAQTRAHHLRRSASVGALLAEDHEATPWQVASKLDWSAGWAALTGIRLFSAVSQTALHMRHLAGD